MNRKILTAILIIVVLFLLYRDSFRSPFFQDDFLLLKLARQSDWFLPIKNFPYRPISIQAFYGLGLFFLGENAIGFHAIAFVIFLATIYFVYRLSLEISRKTEVAFLATAIYSLNISLFPLFYWVATSYFLLAGLFVIAGTFFYLHRGRYADFLVLTAFVLGLLSNEIVIVFPILIVLLCFLVRKFQWTRIILYSLISCAYFLIRVKFAAFPQATDYTVDLNPLTFFATFRWYFLRIWNLPEGVRIMGTPVIYILFLSLVFLVLRKIYLRLSNQTFNGRLLVFSILWFFFAALPFFFLPRHMSAYYLTISLFGPSLFLADLFGNLTNRVLTALFLIGYAVMAFWGIDYLSHTHWIILKLTR